MSSSFRRLVHWGPAAVLCIIKLITFTMVHMIGMWWPPYETFGGGVHALMFLAVAVTTLYYFLQALLIGPGFVPPGWKPIDEDDEEFLQYCMICDAYKAPRSHHCKKCGRCVMKMDHHCPWINCCVGHFNHKYFVKFLVAAVLGCLHASTVLCICIYHAINRVWYTYHGTGEEPIIDITLTSMLITLLAIGSALGVVLTVGALLYLQIRGILFNRTAIEDWIIEKATVRRLELGLVPFRYPYDLGYSENVSQFRKSDKLDGLHWPTADGCGQFDFTMEQLAQKLEKMGRSRTYVATRSYSGARVPLLAYPRAACWPPCTDEPRLALAVGDTVRATRRRRNWLFGQLVVAAVTADRVAETGDGADAAGVPGAEPKSEKSTRDRLTRSRPPRGWFPQDCVAPAGRGKSD